MSSCQIWRYLRRVWYSLGLYVERIVFEHVQYNSSCNFKYLTPIWLHTSSRAAHFHISNWIIIYFSGDVLSPLIFIDYNCATFKGYRSPVASLLCGATSGYRKVVMRCMCAVHQFLGARSFYDTHIFRGNLRQLHSSFLPPLYRFPFTIWWLSTGKRHIKLRCVLMVEKGGPIVGRTNVIHQPKSY